MADINDEIEEEAEEEKGKKRKKREKKKGKEGKNFDVVVSDKGAEPALYTDADSEDDDGGGFGVFMIVVFIVIIWLAILALLVKLDIGGFGSGVLYPVLKDVPVLNRILPDNLDPELEAGTEYRNLNEAVAEINRLNDELAALKKKSGNGTASDSSEVAALKEEIKRLKTFEDSQVEFQKLKTEFYEEVVFNENAPDVEAYRAYYEEIDPDNAEYIYRQVVQQIETNGELADYVKAYSEMKPKQAAAIFEMMPDNLDLVAKILGQMEASQRAKILGVMDSEIASQITKIMDPD